MTDIYDQRKAYDEEIEPLVRALKVECAMRHLPMFVSVAVANSEDGTEYRSEMVAAGTGVSLNDNRIGTLLMRLNGLVDDSPPEWVKKEMADLGAYLARAKIAEEDRLKPEIRLKDDLIPGYAADINEGKKEETGNEHREHHPDR